MYNSIMDLKKVINELKDPNKHIFMHDVCLGSPAMPQLAAVSTGPEDAFKKMKGRPFSMDCKFDGERMQVHVVSSDVVRYFSRRGHEHGAKSDFNQLDPLIQASVRGKGVVLDGELVVWNRSRETFEPFGAQRAILSAVDKGLGPDDLLEVVGGGWRKSRLLLTV